MGIVKFRVTALRPALLLGVAEVWGHHGFWPLRKPVNYRVGGNCDAIRVDGGKLLVLMGKRTIAEAKYAPRPNRAQAGGDVKWEKLLQPRNRNGR
jgi:hypothetical protein